MLMLNVIVLSIPWLNPMLNVPVQEHKKMLKLVTADTKPKWMLMLNVTVLSIP